ncbi:MAG: hypothetical protein CVT77_01210 [Alphaproteobacteria bacterium HGW-Alphaproteobacteria-16]|nr:MAG: hypothetical protein CVT77_01210 [Alphaproteobacteria bacterium HGW-Alphaproteobacteria-16]
MHAPRCDRERHGGTTHTLLGNLRGLAEQTQFDKLARDAGHRAIGQVKISGKDVARLWPGSADEVENASLAVAKL